ncbi:VIT family-domain-containing protein [Kockiozyma suomiensis]|uniref:VIT family-domain-containing protein n=1 Tax=Kockiozyma suomiensis TaxID=1337062 RepID=UPI003343D1D5
MATLVRCLFGYNPIKNSPNRQPSYSTMGDVEAGTATCLNSSFDDETDPLLQSDRSVSVASSSTLLDSEAASSSSSITVASSSSVRSHWFSPRLISDAVIGLSDGLTVPFALTAGLSSLGNTKIVVTGGIAELVSGAISMGLGGYLGAKSESDCYKSQLEKERLILQNARHLSEEAVTESLAEYGFAESTVSAILGDLEKSPEEMVNFVMKFGRGMEEPPIGREFISAATIGTAYFLGGFVPLFPYFFVNTVQLGLILSSVIMIVTLFVFGVAKTIFTGNNSKAQAAWGGVQMVITGAVAAGAAYAMVRFIDTA